MEPILLEKETNDVKSFNSINWPQEYNKAADKDAFIEKFIDSFLQSHNINSGIGFRKSLHEQLKLFGDKGFSEEFNPFLEWMIKYDKTVGGLNNINDEEYMNLNGLYGERVIFEKDLTGTSTLGTKTVLFNKDFFTKEKTDFTYLAKVFYYLNSRVGREYVLDKIKALDKTQKYEFVQRLKADFSLFFTDKVYKDPEVLKYYIVFKDGKYSPQGDLRDAHDISLAISYLDNKVQDKEVQNNNRNQDEQRPQSNEDKEFQSKIEEVKKGLLELRFKEKLVNSVLRTIVDSETFNKDSSTSDILQAALRVLRNIRG